MIWHRRATRVFDSTRPQLAVPLMTADDGEKRAFARFSAEQAAATERAHKQRLLRRIADALQVTDGTFVQSEVLPLINDSDLNTEGEALLHAYRRIHDPEERQRLLALVQEVAERS